MPALSNRWLTLQQGNRFEEMYRPIHFACLKLYADDPDNIETDPILFPMQMSAELAAKLPMTVVTTRQFDHFR